MNPEIKELISNDIKEHPYKENKNYWNVEEENKYISIEEQFSFCMRKDIYVKTKIKKINP